MKKAFFFALLITATIVSGCARIEMQERETAAAALCSPDDYGQNVVYFPCTGDRFAERLQEYKSQNPSLAVTAMVNTASYDEVRTYGFLVNFEPVKAE